LLEREREREEANNLQAECITTLQDRVAALETEMHKAAAAMLRVESEGTAKYSEGDTIISKVEESVQARLLEFDLSLTNRLNSAGFHSNPAAEPPTLTEHTTEVAELADRLMTLEAELRHQGLAMKQTLKRTVASLETQVGQQRIQIYTFADELREEQQSRDFSDGRTESRLASLEATRGEPAVASHGCFEEMASLAISMPVSNGGSRSVMPFGVHQEATRGEPAAAADNDFEEMASLATFMPVSNGDSRQSVMATPPSPRAANFPEWHDGRLPGPPHQAPGRWLGGLKDHMCARKNPRMMCP